MEILIGWAVLAGLIALAAPGRGRSFAAWFLVGLLLSPVISLLGLLLLPNAKEERAKEQARDKVAAAQLAALQQAAVPREDTMGAIARLADLRDRGAISGEDYEAKKAELLARV